MDAGVLDECGHVGGAYADHAAEAVGRELSVVDELVACSLLFPEVAFEGLLELPFGVLGRRPVDPLRSEGVCAGSE